MPPLSGSQPSRKVARLGVLRLGASRLGHYQPILKLTINGVSRASDSTVRIEGISIRDYLDGQPNIATMRVFKFTPTKGHEVKIGLGSMDVAQLIFAGHIQTVKQIYEVDNPANVAYDLTCISYEYLLNRRKVFVKYTNLSASQIAINLIANFTAGFTYVHVQTGLATIDEFSCTQEDVTDALDRLAKRIGGYWYIDEGRDLHFFTTAEGSAHAITNTDSHKASNIALTTDLTPVRTRLLSEGGGSNALVDIAVGQTTLPVDSGAWYAAIGGTVVAGPQRITYTGKSSVEGTGTTVAGKPLSPGTPTATVATLASKSVSSITRTGSTASATTSTAHGWSTGFKVTIAGAAQNEYNGTVSITVTGSTTFDYAVSGTPATPATGTITATHGGSGNLSVGAYQYKATVVTPNGESEVGSASSAATIADVTTPGAPSAAVTSGTSGNLAVGDYNYRQSYVTAKGETLAGSASSNATIANVSAPGSPSAAAVSGTAGNLGVGTFTYALEYVTSAGETTGGSTASASIAHVTAPASAASASGTTGGSLTASATYYYTTTYVTAAGETPRGYGGAGETSVTLTAGQNAVSLTSIPSSSDGRVTNKRIYRSAANAAYGPFLLLATIANGTTSYSDTTADSGLGGTHPPETNTSGSGQISLTSLPTSGDGRVTNKRIYRTTAGGTQRKLVATIAAGDSSYTDNVADGSLGVSEPTVNTSGSGRIDVTLLTSTDARVTKRRVYRISSDGRYRLLATVNDNTTTSLADNTAESGLGVEDPVTATAGSGQTDLTSIPLGPAGTTSRKLYRTEAAGSVFKALATISGNTQTAFTDNIADSSLGEEAPTESHVGVSTGDTVLRVKDTAVVGASGGWVTTDGGQVIRFTGRSTSSGEGNLTGIPASGTGSIAAAIPFDAAVVNAGFLTGIPASGDGSVQYALTKGEPVNVLATLNDATAQSNMAGWVGGDGIHEDYIQDNRLSLTEATARGQAKLTELKDPIVTLTYETKDITTRSGRSVTVNLAAPQSISGTFKIQSVTITQFDPLNRFWPLRQVTASSRRESFEAILRILKKQAA